MGNLLKFSDCFQGGGVILHFSIIFFRLRGGILKTLKAIKLIFWILYLSLPFISAFFVNFISTKISEKIIGRKLIYYQDTAAKIVLSLTMLIFALTAFYIYLPVFYKSHDKISNFEFKSEHGAEDFIFLIVILIAGYAIFLFILYVFGTITEKITSKFISPPNENDNSIKNFLRSILFSYAFKFVGAVLIIIICIILIIFVI